MRANSSLRALPSGLLLSERSWLDEMERRGIPRRVAIANSINAVLADGTAVSGDAIATHAAGGKEHQVVMVAEADGNIIGSLPDYVAWFTPTTNAASREWGELFNAHATKILRVRGIWVVPTLTAITGVNIGFDVNKINTVPTGGTTITPRALDSSFAALSSVTAMFGSTGGAALDHRLWAGYHFNEETNASTALIQHQNLIPSSIGNRVAEIVLRQNQGVQIKQHGAGTVGLTGCLMYFTVEG